MITTLTHYQPAYGPRGEPFTVTAYFDNREAVCHCWTKAEAEGAREEAFDQGAYAVRIHGLPARLAAVHPDQPPPLADVED